jgi:hypothetical protein
MPAMTAAARTHHAHSAALSIVPILSYGLIDGEPLATTFSVSHMPETACPGTKQLILSWPAVLYFP